MNLHPVLKSTKKFRLMAYNQINISRQTFDLCICGGSYQSESIDMYCMPYKLVIES